MEKKSNPFVLKDIISDDDSNQNSSQKKKKNKVAFSLNKKKNLENENKNNTERLITDSNRELLPKKVQNDNKNSLNFEIDKKNIVKFNKKKQNKHLKSKSESVSSSLKLFSSSNSENNDKKKEITNENEIEKKKLFESVIEDDNELNINDLNKKKNINDDYDKNEYFLKIQTFDFYTLYFTLITFVCGILYHIITYFPNLQGIYSTNKSLYNLSRNFCLIICSTSSICFILASLNRYIIYLLFDKCSGNVEQKVSFFSYDYFGGFLIESLLALIHPSFIGKDRYFTTKKTIYRTETKYEVNDILLLICLLRIYIFIRYYISTSQFNTPRSQRIAKLIGGNLNRLFVVKCLIIKNPFKFLIVISLSIILVGSFMLRIAESPAYEEPTEEGTYNDNDYRKFENCIWNVMITMTTVGYGDYYPITLIGRLVNVFLSIAGTLLTSYMVVFLQNELVFTDNEDMAFNFREKSVLKEKFEQKAANYYSTGFKYIIAKKRYVKACKLRIPKRGIDQLKSKMKEALYNKIKAKRAFKKVFQNYQNTYEAWDDEDILKQKMDDFQDKLTSMNENCNQMEEHINDINNLLNQIQEAYNEEKKEENEEDIIDTSKK